MSIQELQRAVNQGCKTFDVKRLDVFGSFARGAESDVSDVDLLVEFQEPNREPAKRFFGLLHHLEDTLERDIDLLTLNSLKNPYFKNRILEEKILVYER